MIHLTENDFAQLFEDWYQALYNFAFRYIKDRDICEDMVQDVFMMLWKKNHNIEIERSLKNYLFTAVRNSCLAYIRRQSLEQAYMESQQEKELKSIDVDKEADAMLLKSKILKAVDQLPGKCRNVFLLSKMEGLTYEEVAAHLSISVKTVEKQIGNAYKRLRPLLKDVTK